MKKHESKRNRGKVTGTADRATSLHSARTRKEVALAELRELEVRRKRESLVDADEVRREWEGALRRFRAAALAVPSRLRSRLPHLTAHDAEVIDQEIRAALTSLANGDGA